MGIIRHYKIKWNMLKIKIIFLWWPQHSIFVLDCIVHYPLLKWIQYLYMELLKSPDIIYWHELLTDWSRDMKYSCLMPITFTCLPSNVQIHVKTIKREWVLPENATITHSIPTHDTLRKRQRTTTATWHPEDNKSKATSSLCTSSMITKLEKDEIIKLLTSIR